MSNKDAQERTELPTPRRLRKLREKGNLAKSKDLASTATLTGILATLFIGSPWFMEQFEEFITAPFPFLGQPFAEAVVAVTKIVAINAALILVPLLLIPVLLAVATYLIQNGFIFAIDPLLPKMERLNPAEGLKRLFSLPHVVEVAKAIIKTLVLGFALYFLLKNAMQPLVMLPFIGIYSIVQMTARLMRNLFLMSILVFIIVSLLDVYIQKRLFLHENKMSKSDVKRDYKDAEGDPLIKSKRRMLHTLLNAPEPGDDSSD